VFVTCRRFLLRAFVAGMSRGMSWTAPS